MIDIHTHIAEYEQTEIDQIINRAKNAGVKSIISASTTLNSCKKSIYLSEKFDMIYSGIGLHPMDLTQEINQEILLTLENFSKTYKKVLVLPLKMLLSPFEIYSKMSNFPLMPEFNKIRGVTKIIMPIKFNSLFFNKNKK